MIGSGRGYGDWRKKSDLGSEISQPATAVDVGKSKILVGEVDPTDPRRLHVDRIDVGIDPTVSLADLLARVEASPATARPVGVALFGPLDTDPSSLTYASITNASDPRWEGVNVPRAIFEATGRSVRFHYDTHATLVSARLFKREGPPLSTISAGTGIGAAHDSAWANHQMPQFGHMWVRRREDDHFSGSCRFHRDCLQGLASGRALATRVHADPSELPSDHPALDLAQYYLAQGLHAIECVLGRRQFLLAGGLAARTHFVEGVSQHLATLQHLANGVGGPGMESLVAVAPAGQLSALHGAALMAVDRESMESPGNEQVGMVYPPRT